MKNIMYAIALLFSIVPHAQAEINRPSLITEEMYAPRSNAHLYKQHSRGLVHNERRNEELLWHKALLSMGIQNPAPKNERYYRGNCHYDTALRILNNIRDELGQNTPYQKIWSENQKYVFTACDQSERAAPKMPEGNSLPIRALSDYKYQLASWNFYNRDYEEALALYKEIADNKESSMRGLASYMVIRSLSAMRKNTEAYKKAEEILADKSLSTIHNLTANQRFILMYNKGAGDDQIVEEHLRWLLSLVTIDPFSVTNMDQALSDYLDALEHLDKYFPLTDDNGAVDWWLHNQDELKSPRMKAVYKLSPEFELVDWMQASWAFNIFDQDWLWSLHDKQNPYWEQNANIVKHAWERYKKGDGLEWLGIAIQRIQSDSPLTKGLLKDADKYLYANFQNETNEYKDWLQNLWQHSIRLKLGLKQYDQAATLASDKKFDYDLGRSSWQRRYINISQSVIPKAIRYLVYIGEFDQARTLLANTEEHLQERAANHWKTLLAQDMNDVLNLNLQAKYPPEIWMAMVNTFSAKEQKDLVQKYNGNLGNIKKELSLAALTKAMLLKKKDIYEYASVAGDENIVIKSKILEAVEDKDEYGYVEFMLRTPRMRPVPFPLSLIGPSNLTPEQIDLFNHNDNNWWCAYDLEGLSDEIWDHARILPRSSHTFSIEYNEGDERLQDRYEENIQRLLDSHPYHQYTDKREDKKLAKIPSGPKYLSEEVIAQEKSKLPRLWWTADAKHNNAANLYYAVKTTRYGCERNGSHAAYSYGAYKLLKKNYDDTIWSKETPYWFSDKHF